MKPAVVTERRTGERGEPGRSGVTTAVMNHHGPLPVSVLDPEVLEISRRQRFTAAYKLRILQEADALRKSGQISALLPRPAAGLSCGDMNLDYAAEKGIK